MSERRPAPAVPAASVMLLHDGREGLEILMLLRHPSTAFAPGALVFTGGKVASGDATPELRHRCGGAVGMEPAALVWRIAAIRETFEESGVLIAHDSIGGELVSGNRAAALQGYRAPLNRGELDLSRFVDDEDLILACDRLEPFAHWITPEWRPLRFDTHFYLASLPPGQKAAHDGTESVDSFWITPAHALAEGRAGRYDLMFPTRLNLERLSRSETVDAALAAAREIPIVTVMPWVEQRAGGTLRRIPDDAGYGHIAKTIEEPPVAGGAATGEGPETRRR